ncbi:MFS transporter [Rhizobium sp. NFR07]|uniref:MFS transporter n=1 Tax=Rhizobium sp. NFR07 TaxID=1566262 RepID=UPI001FCD15AB|nr:MFS transporter [Rhizobium sp. NFR07]
MTHRHSLKTLCLVAAGGALEFYDFVIFIFVADFIATLFFPPHLPAWLVSVQTFGIFATGYLFRPLGGVVFAHFGDLFGRRNVFLFSILLMASSTLSMAFLPDYSEIGIAAPVILMLLRILQGIAIGGEVPGAWTFASEHIAPERVGFACGIVGAGLAFGVFLGSVVMETITTTLSTEDMLHFGWRLPFLLGGMLGVIAVYLRRMLHETPVFMALRAHRSLIPEPPLRTVLKHYRGGIVISVLCTWVVAACVLTLSLLMPTILQKLHYIGRLETLTITSISAAFRMLAVILAGIAVDYAGPASVFIVGGGLLAAGACALATLESTGMNYLCIVSAVIGLSGAVATAVPVVMIRSFPPQVRFSGVSFSYTVSYAVFGGALPLCMAALSEDNALAHVYFLLCVSAGAVIIGIYLWFSPAIIRYRRHNEDGEPTTSGDE